MIRRRAVDAIPLILSLLFILASPHPALAAMPRLVPYEFVIPGPQGASGFVTGEFARWNDRAYSLRYDPSRGAWVGLHDVPPGPSDWYLVTNGAWSTPGAESDPRRYFLEIRDPAKGRILLGYEPSPCRTVSDRITLRGRYVPPPGEAGVTILLAFLDNLPLAVSFDALTGLFSLETANLDVGLNTVAVYARHGATPRAATIYHVVRLRPEAGTVPVMRVSGEMLAGEELRLDARPSFAHGARIMSYRWSASDEALEIAGATSAITSARASRAGRFVVSLEVTDDLGRTERATQEITVAEPPAHLARTVFRLFETDLPPGIASSTVTLAGDWNGWNKDAMPLRRSAEGTWSGHAWLSPGDHEYKFVLNGTEWLADPRNPLRRGNYANSVVRVAGPAGNAAASSGGVLVSGISPHVRDAILYQVMVPRFCDSDGDGTGDLPGLTSKLDEIRDLGVNWIYLLPIFQSPSLHGYHTTDYYTIDPQLGTIEDFRAFVAAAHARGLRVMLDYVFNHSSADHPFFVLAHADTASPYRRWYRWTGENSWEGFGGANTAMPGWNFGNPEVRRYGIDVALYWIDQGVDGYRCDVAHAVPDDFWQEWSAALRSRKGDILLFPEFNEPHFDLFYDWGATKIFDAFAGRPAEVIDEILKTSESDGRVPVRFLDYHDRDRAMSAVGGDDAKMRLAALLLMTSPGVPMIYYGSEIGMKGLMSDNTNREMMDWEGGDRGLREHYKALIALRRAHPCLSTGAIRRLLVSGDEGVYAFLRDGGGERIVVVMNLRRTSATARIDLSAIGGARAAAARPLVSAPTPEVSGGRLSVRLEPFQGGVYRLE